MRKHFKRNRIFFSALIGVFFLSSTYAQVASTQKIFFNGRIFTANPEQPYADAVVVQGDKIIAVGSLSQVKSKVDPKSELVDLQGKYLLPGLIDSHVHALSGGEHLMGAAMNDVLVNKEELRAFASTTLLLRKGMRGDVLYIRGMHSGTWAAANDLDDLFNKEPYLTQPVVLRGSDGHTAWVNKVMLKRAKIDKNFILTLSAADKKYFGVDAENNPNGLISEDGFQKINAVMPASVIDPVQAGEQGVKHLNSLGITAWLDPSTGNISEGINNSRLNVYQKLALASKLKAHVVSTVVADGDGDVVNQIATLKKLQTKYGSVKDLSIIGFKIFADGVLEYPTQTGAISIPYKNSGSLGSLMFDPEKFKMFVTKADKEKLLVHIHAIGDRAVTESLNAYEAARKANGNSGIIHSITHLQLVKPTDFKRFAELNVFASAQLLWASADMYTLELVNPYVDSTITAHQYPALSLVKAGVTVAGASDWSVSSANPFEAIAQAETRTGKLGVLDANEIMPRLEMLKAYTINAAKLIMKDKMIGSIEPGKQADFVLVDRDVMSISPEEIKDTKVLWTMFGGEIVYKKP